MSSSFQKLEEKLPSDSMQLVQPLLTRYPLLLKISRARTTKAGDYRPPQNGKGHIISVNHNLSPEAFLLTLLHELAHLYTWEEYGRRVNPHGSEWKITFRHLSLPFLAENIFPENLKEPLAEYFRNPSATTVTHPLLHNALSSKSDDPNLASIDEIAVDMVFRLPNGKRFRKVSKLRKNIKCLSLDNGKFYIFKPVARIEPVSD